MDEIRVDRGAVALIANTLADAVEALASRVQAGEADLAAPLRKVAAELRAAVRAPGIVSLEPAQGAEVPVDQPVRVVFDGPVIADSVQLELARADGGKPLKATVTQGEGEGARVVELHPSPLKPGVEYQATLRAAKGGGGWELARPETWTFTVKG